MELRLDGVSITPQILVQFNEIQKKHSQNPFSIIALGEGNTHNKRQIFDGATISFSMEEIDSVIDLLNLVKNLG